MRLKASGNPSVKLYIVLNRLCPEAGELPAMANAEAAANNAKSAFMPSSSYGKMPGSINGF